MAWSSQTGDWFVDQRGQPFDDRLQEALRSVAPRLRREFPSIRDEVTFTEILEEAGQLIAQREATKGRVGRLRGYAWMTARNVANARLRRPAVRHHLATFEHNGEPATLSKLAARTDTAEAVQRDVEIGEVLAMMSTREHAISVRKLLGFTTVEIGTSFRMSPSAVDTMFCRAKQRVADKIRAAVRRRERPTGGDTIAGVRAALDEGDGDD